MARGGQRTRPRCRLDHHSDARRGDQPVPAEEPLATRRRAGRNLADDGPGGCHVAQHLRVCHGIELVHATRHHGNRQAARSQDRAVRRHVDAKGSARHDRRSGIDETSCQKCRHVGTVCGRGPRSHHGRAVAPRRVEVGRAPHVQREWGRRPKVVERDRPAFVAPHDHVTAHEGRPSLVWRSGKVEPPAPPLEARPQLLGKTL